MSFVLGLSVFLWACTPKEEVPMKELTKLETEQLTPALMPHVQSCYDESMRKLPNSRRKVELVFRINAKGSAKSYTEQAPNDFSKDLVNCVNDKISKLELDMPEGSSGGTLSVELSPE